MICRVFNNVFDFYQILFAVCFSYPNIAKSACHLSRAKASFILDIASRILSSLVA